MSVSQLSVLFNDNINEAVGINNVSITSELDSVPNPEVISVSVDEKTLTVGYRPIFPNVQYKIKFFSTDSQNFKTVNGEVISEDENRNTIYITSPGDEENDIRDFMMGSLPEIYDTDEGSIIRDLVYGISNELQKTDDAIKTTKSGNYLSVTVEDESMIRGSGPTDKLDNGGVYAIDRVAKTLSGNTGQAYLDFSESRTMSFMVRSDVILNPIISTITDDPISLQAIDVVNEKITDNIDLNNYFDGMSIRVDKGPVIQVISVSLYHDDEWYEYDIQRFGYTISDNRYDTSYGRKNSLLTNRDIELSLKALLDDESDFIEPAAGDEIRISYVYKKLGRSVSVPVSITTTRYAVRETVPASINRFYLDHAPIITTSDVIATNNGVEFLNTEATETANPFESTHPAFVKEVNRDNVTYATSYSVNYTTGEVNVYGKNNDNNGTGSVPPVATYTYRKTFVNGLDFTYNSTNKEIAIDTTRIPVGTTGKVNFYYEDIFAPGTDYNISSHVEVLGERVNNKLISSFKVRTNHFPVTNVFRIYNETTGEIYSTSRFSDSEISFTGRTAPAQIDVSRERAYFLKVSQETILISDELESSRGFRVLKCELANSGITDSRNRFIGSNFDTSITFSNTNIFLREFFYEDRLFTSITNNIERLKQIGDYCVDYNNGIIYIAVSADQDDDLGDISYQYKKIKTKYPHILEAKNIYRSTSAILDNVENYTYESVSDTAISISDLEQVGERFINNNSSRTLIVGTYQSGEDGVTTLGDFVFTANSASFTEDDLGRILRVGSADNNNVPTQDLLINGILNEKQVLTSPEFTYTNTGRVWTVIDLSETSDKIITLNHNISSIREIYSLEQVGKVSSAELDGYYDINHDSFEDNVITLSENNVLQVGDAVVVNYDYGNLFLDYKYLKDEILLYYEYGKNSIDWSISNAILEGEQYFVSYRYGALRDFLLTNFGALTQIPELTAFSTSLNREVYRSILKGTLQSFIEGPTINSIKTLVEAFTNIEPNITAPDDWRLGNNHLTPKDIYCATTPEYDLGKYENGIVIDGSQYLKIPAVSHLKLNEGTIETWVRPQWSGLDNDSTITFDLTLDGYSNTEDVFIGFEGNNPDEIPFSLSNSFSCTGEPANIDSNSGFFIWYDNIENIWNLRWRHTRDAVHEFSGTINTSGEFKSVGKATDSNNIYITEITDLITSTTSEISFNGFIDGYDGDFDEDEYYSDGIVFSSGDLHYIFDMEKFDTSNKMSMFKDGTGYLNFQVFDNRTNNGLSAGFYNLSKYIGDWEESELHHVAASWKFNSAEEKDEMHLFVDGEETTNLFKYGGNPKASSTYDFGDVAEEIVIASCTRPIVGGFDGTTEKQSTIFRSSSVDFAANGILPGDSLYILEDTGDGTASPNSGTAYPIIGVGSTSIQVDREFTLSLGAIHYSINQVTATVNTSVNFQDFIMVSRDANGSENELSGVDSDEPDYSIRRGDNYTHVITINNGVALNEAAIIKPLGLIFKRCKEKVYVYGNTNEIRLNSAPPVSLNDVDITAILMNKTLIDEGITEFDDGYFCDISNEDWGKKLSIKISGDNTDFSGSTGAYVLIQGLAYSGAISEMVEFTENSTQTTTEYWKRIDLITVSILSLDPTEPAGVIEIREKYPITQSENYGDYAEVVGFENGLITLNIYGSGGQQFILNSCLYEIDYPSYLRIRLDEQPEYIYIGSDSNGENNADAVLDEFRILDYMSEDTRAGENLGFNETSITTDYNRSIQFSNNSNTLLLLHFDNNLVDSSSFIDRFNEGFETAPSVNSDFGSALKINDNKAFIIENGSGVFNNNEGTIEFWVHPLNDTQNDPNYKFYLDMSSIVEQEVTSVTKVTLIASQKIQTLSGIYLKGDVYRAGVDYSVGASVSNVDRKTITLSVPLLLQNTPVVIQYVPVGNSGDRVSIYKDPDGFVNFFMRANGIDHVISHHVNWSRNTWHRIMAMWSTNNSDNNDRIRLFVDGSERGVIKWGTNLLYGSGILWGQQEVRDGRDRFVVDDINLEDTFARIYIGTDTFGFNNANALIDNLRFSEEQRTNLIRISANDTLDTQYVANSNYAVPVTTDSLTTGLYDFDKEQQIIESFVGVLNAERGIYRFNIEVIDSFGKIIGNQYLVNLLEILVNRIKPAHTEVSFTYTS